MNAYAYLCEKCGHLLSRHSMISNVEPSKFRCREDRRSGLQCRCVVEQDSPAVPLSKRQYLTYIAALETSKRKAA